MPIDVPFYPNHEDNLHCEMSVYASVLDYFLHKKLPWNELEKLVGYKPGKAAWTVEALPKLAKMGLDIKMVEPFDYERYLKEGKKYLESIYNPDELKWHYQYSNIVEMKRFIPHFQKTINHETRVAKLSDIDSMLDEGRLVFVTVNSRALSGQDGYVSHALLIIGKHAGEYIAHDPGLPPKPYRRVDARSLMQAMGGNHNTSEVTGFKLAKTS